MRIIAIGTLVMNLVCEIDGQAPAVDLRDGQCKAEVSIAALDGLRVSGSCETKGADRVMKISVTNVAPKEVGPLRGFSIGFCGSGIISASAPSGWVSTVNQDPNGSVDWTVPEALAGQFGVPSRARVSGFVVQLKAGWRLSRSASALWESAGTAVSTTHDCDVRRGRPPNPRLDPSAAARPEADSKRK
jgi:hypothetical protein